MKNLKSLIVILFLICSSFLTIATAQEKKQDSTAVKKFVVLDSIQSKGVIADIVAGDYCEKELAATRFVLKATEFKSLLQEKVIENREEKIKAGQKIEEKKDEQLSAAKEVIKDTRKQLQHQEVKTWIYKAAVVVLVASNIYFVTR